MGALALLASWGVYRYTNLLAAVPFTRLLDWVAAKVASLVHQPWAVGMTGAILVVAAPAAGAGLLVSVSTFLSWPTSVAIVVLCMGPMRLFDVPAPGDTVIDVNSRLSSMTPEQYHALAARDVIGSLFWAAILGAPGAVFYRAAQELAESPTDKLKGEAELLSNARVLFGWLYWLPARVYAIAQMASGSGGRLDNMLSFSSDSAASDALVMTACGDKDAAVSNGSKAMMVAAIGIAALAFIL